MPAAARPRTTSIDIAIRIVAALMFAAVVLFGRSLGQVPDWLVLIYAAMSLVSLAAYGYDKFAAINGDWRVSEATLHGLDLLGGVAGGLVAQAIFRHKTSKPDFALVTGVIVLLHLLGLAALFLRFIHLPGQTLFG